MAVEMEVEAEAEEALTLSHNRIQPYQFHGQPLVLHSLYQHLPPFSASELYLILVVLFDNCPWI